MAAFAIRREATAFALDKSGKDTQSFKDDNHLAFIRTLPSVVSGVWPTEACHIRTGSAEHNKKKTGKGQKPSDAWVLPLTPEEHREQHSGSEIAFWNRHGINPFDLASKLYAVSGDEEAAIAIIRNARART
ncbi:hypothetical protein [Brucella intermedia]|uniref:hypothetical protein n=1 Tax=Brucella intermedia TaxID=94625 RepID=UPI00235FCFAA|nr:hypothetical protein [Brucella intermedia]